MSRSLLILLVCSLVVSTFAQQQPPQKATQPNVVPVISGDLGDCSADLTVRDAKAKPIYGAKVAVELRYGFVGFRHLKLEVYTNVDGKARVEGLPNNNKNPLTFTAEYKGRKAAVVVDPSETCHGTYTAVITDQPVKTDEDTE